MTKTYEQRLADLATEMAKATWDAMKPNAWNGYLNEVDRKEYVSNYIVSAAIALKHMATMYSVGFTDGRIQKSNIDSLGLIQPQKP